MRIGVVKEIKQAERRVALTPAGAQQLVALGSEVLVEAGAGVGSGFSDDAYTVVGAQIVPAAAEVWQQSELLLKVKEPIEPEYPLMHADLTVPRPGDQSVCPRSDGPRVSGAPGRDLRHRGLAGPVLADHRYCPGRRQGVAEPLSLARLPDRLPRRAGGVDPRRAHRPKPSVLRRAGRQPRRRARRARPVVSADGGRAVLAARPHRPVDPRRR